VAPLDMALACLTPNGDPYITVVWFRWLDGVFWIVPRARSLWAQHLAYDGRCSFVVSSRNPYKKVQGQGRVEVVEEPNVGGRWVEHGAGMARRSLGEHGETYIAGTFRQPRWLLCLHPSKIVTWQGTAWAPRYWVKDAGGPTWQEAFTMP